MLNISEEEGRVGAKGIRITVWNQKLISKGYTIYGF
jgi:hypothetical protein